MKLQDLLRIKSEREFKDTCKNNLAYLGSGVGRDVYMLGSNQVIKVARNGLGYSQNASEVETYNIYGSLGLFNEIIRSSKCYLWVVQPLAGPLKKDDEEFKRIVDMINHIELSNEYPTGNDFLKRLYDFLIETKWKFLQDFKKASSWGRVNNELRIIDYGMNNEAFKDYFTNQTP